MEGTRRTYDSTLLMLAFNSLLPISVQIWSLGCVLAEMFTGYVLFQNDSVQTMLARIQGVLGPFPERSLALARDTAKYMTPNNIVYERVRVRGEQQQQRRRGGRSKKNRGEGKDADEGKVEGGRPSTPPSEGEEEGEEEEEEDAEAEADDAMSSTARATSSTAVQGQVMAKLEEIKEHCNGSLFTALQRVAPLIWLCR